MPICLFATDSQSLEKETVSIEFTVLSLEAERPESLYFYSSDDLKAELAFKRKARSEIYRYSGKNCLNFYDAKNDMASEKEPVASIQVDGNDDRLLLLFSKSKTTTDEISRWTITALSDDPRSFTQGSIQVFNASDFFFAGKINQHQFFLPSRESTVLSHDSSSFIDVKFATKAKQRYEIVYDNKIACSPLSRSILILRSPRRPKSLQIDTWLIEDDSTQELSLVQLEKD